MRLFRRSLDLTQASIRLSDEYDLSRVARLFRDGARRYYNFAGSDLPALLSAAHAVVIESANEIWAVALAGWRTDQTTWLRGVALAEGFDITPGLNMLLPALHAELRARELQHIFYAGDDVTDTWLRPRLQAHGYVADTEVIAYEKRGTDVPAYGNLAVHIRTAQPVDLAAVVALDHACFEAQWTKDDITLQTAIEQGPLCILAEVDACVAGYAYATMHFSGRLIHLVRIAVDPRWQGQGIGVRLLSEVIAFARQHNATLITLNTQSYNTQAQRLYHWFGFHPTGERQIILRCAL